ncbi:uncharacterized protein LOC123877545 isoform X2 [Maniola jurtina]|uniref:uncharacterized protein LOC123877545 isoform X2 n=1 Tax=Maniola jurtina TaxID=191418 RepID=UPI001E68F244|nr:uncharacterized protein LOC123877545 isoform X2 [Maniola jurtina]
MYKELKVTLLTLVFMEVLVKCSKVIDEKSQQAIYPANYCKRIGICAEGTHVMCTHFNPNKTKGPLCTGTEDVSINEDYAKLLLDLLNVIRSRSARGKTFGLGNLTLPRAYGMYRLEWDPELSTLAQVWANTCTIGQDMCRATERFPDPGQVLGLTRFDENWIPVNARTLFNYTGFSLEKVVYGIHSTLRSWYRSKENVHPDDITDQNYIWPKHLSSNSFLEIIHGRATHVGCGISVFIEFDYAVSKEHTLNLFHHVVRVICNLSSRILSTPRKYRVYTTDPPTEVGYTVKCGCPLGYDEDDDCLCYESGRQLPFSCKGKECKPAVVILPIITVENAPPSKLSAEYRNESNCKMMKTEIDPGYQDNTHPTGHNLRGSIFLKPSVFELPQRKLKTSESKETKLVKNDVSPRRDFSNARKLVSKYLNTRLKTITDKDVNLPLTVKNSAFSAIKLQNISQVSHTNDAEKEDFEKTRLRIVFDNLILPRNTINTKSPKVKTNSKIMSLLNKLEEEAENVQLACDRKNVLDHKIRKIYNTFVEKAVSTRKSSNINEVKDKTTNLDEFLGNDRLHKHEEQFSTIREKDLNKFKNNQISNKEGLRNSKTSVKVNQLDNNFKDTSFSNKKYRELFGIRNMHGIRNNQNNKREETNDFNNENTLSRRDDDILTLEKRKFYQDKLDYLERKLQVFDNNDRNRDKVNACRPTHEKNAANLSPTSKS